jgi:hypothetical protein
MDSTFEIGAELRNAKYLFCLQKEYAKGGT